MTELFADIPVRQELQTIAFYNLENLFDLEDDPYTNDNDFLHVSAKKWTPKRYRNKLRKLSYAISNIGRRETGKHPAIVGMAEVENAKVIEDLINSKHLEPYNYGYVHYNSLDERGIDVALIYDMDYFKVTSSNKFTIELMTLDGLADYTRDILLVSGQLDGETMHIIVNHWSSRREGEKETEPKRLTASAKVGEIIDSLKVKEPDAKILIMGDFNDDPNSKSIISLMDGYQLYNPMTTLRSFNRGSTQHNKHWILFDQILFTPNFLASSKEQFEFYKADIFDEDFLKLFNGPYKGSPFRTYVGKKYKGGYSDHFPVYAIFKKG